MDLNNYKYNINIMCEEYNSYRNAINFDYKIIIDIGANIGDVTHFFLNNSVNSSVLAIEPHPDNVSILKSRFGENSRIQIIDGVIGTNNDPVTETPSAVVSNFLTSL